MKAIKANNSKDEEVFMSALRRLKDKEDFKIVLLKIDSICKYRKDIKADDSIVMARLCGNQHCANYLHDKLDELERGNE